MCVCFLGNECGVYVPSICLLRLLYSWWTMVLYMNTSSSCFTLIWSTWSTEHYSLIIMVLTMCLLHPIMSDIFYFLLHPIMSDIFYFLLHPIMSDILFFLLHPITSDIFYFLLHPITSYILFFLLHPIMSDIFYFLLHPIMSGIFYFLLHPIRSAIFYFLWRSWFHLSHLLEAASTIALIREGSLIGGSLYLQGFHFTRMIEMIKQQSSCFVFLVA